MILSQLTPLRVGFWLEYEEGEGKWVDKLAISLVLSPLPSPFTDRFLKHSRVVCTCYSVSFPFNFHCLVSTKFVRQVEFPMAVCSSKVWENDHRVDGRDPSQCLPVGICCSSSFTAVLVSRKFTPGSTRENQQPCFLLLTNLLLALALEQSPAASRALILSVLVPLMEEVSCGGQGELSEQDSLNISRLNETNPREKGRSCMLCHST